MSTNEKTVLTTGQVADYTGVHFRTVIRWIKRGILNAYQLPGGRGDHRVRIDDFIDFLKENNMPVPRDLLQGKKVLLAVGASGNTDELRKAFEQNGHVTRLADDAFTVGYFIASFKPQAAVIDPKVLPADGGYFFEKIFKLPEGRQIKGIVIVTENKTYVSQTGHSRLMRVSPGCPAGQIVEAVKQILKNPV